MRRVSRLARDGKLTLTDAQVQRHPSEPWRVGDRVRTVGVPGGVGRVLGVGGISGDLHVLLDNEHDPIWLPLVNAARAGEP